MGVRSLSAQKSRAGAKRYEHVDMCTCVCVNIKHIQVLSWPLHVSRTHNEIMYTKKQFQLTLCLLAKGKHLLGIYVPFELQYGTRRSHDAACTRKMHTPLRWICVVGDNVCLFTAHKQNNHRTHSHSLSQACMFTLARRAIALLEAALYIPNGLVRHRIATSTRSRRRITGACLRTSCGRRRYALVDSGKLAQFLGIKILWWVWLDYDEELFWTRLKYQLNFNNNDDIDRKYMNIHYLFGGDATGAFVLFVLQLWDKKRGKNNIISRIKISKN